MDFGNHLYSAFSSLVAVILHLAQELEVYDPKYISIFCMIRWFQVHVFFFPSLIKEGLWGSTASRERSATMASRCHILPLTNETEEPL